jgi:hypothetical protein
MACRVGLPLSNSQRSMESFHAGLPSIQLSTESFGESADASLPLSKLQHMKIMFLPALGRDKESAFTQTYRGSAIRSISQIPMPKAYDFCACGLPEPCICHTARKSVPKMVCFYVPSFSKSDWVQSMFPRLSRPKCPTKMPCRVGTRFSSQSEILGSYGSCACGLLVHLTPRRMTLLTRCLWLFFPKSAYQLKMVLLAVSKGTRHSIMSLGRSLSDSKSHSQLLMTLAPAFCAFTSCFESVPLQGDVSVSSENAVNQSSCLLVWARRRIIPICPCGLCCGFSIQNKGTSCSSYACVMRIAFYKSHVPVFSSRKWNEAGPMCFV